MNWNEIEIFKGIDLNDSFVMSWHRENNELIFNLEASIWPESKFYEKPKKDEYTCYKKAHLIFTNFDDINGLLEMEHVIPSTDASEEKDYGSIDIFQKNSEGFLIEGDFGSVSIFGGEMNFEIKE